MDNETERGVDEEEKEEKERHKHFTHPQKLALPRGLERVIAVQSFFQYVTSSNDVLSRS